MSKRKVLTIQFDVTGLCDDAIASLQDAAEVQAEEFEIVENGEYTDKWTAAVVLKAEVNEVDMDEGDERE